MEWMFGCGRGSVAAKGVRGATAITYPRPVDSPGADKLPEPCKPLLFGFLFFTKRFRVTEVAMVLVQGIRDNVQIPLLESPSPFVDEFDLWGIGALWVNHWDEAVEGGDPGY
jgi:hypothetical protein